jgi:hypothetical protein
MIGRGTDKRFVGLKSVGVVLENASIALNLFCLMHDLLLFQKTWVAEQ